MPLLALVVEDDQNFQSVVQLRLKGWQEDIQIRFANNLSAARTYLNDTAVKYDFVILDQNLPDGPGSSLFEHPRLQEMAVLAVSSDDAPELPARAVRAGAEHFLAKRQVTEPLFIPLLEALLERKRLEGELFKTKLKQSR